MYHIGISPVLNGISAVIIEQDSFSDQALLVGWGGGRELHTFNKISSDNNNDTLFSLKEIFADRRTLKTQVRRSVSETRTDSAMCVLGFIGDCFYYY